MTPEVLKRAFDPFFTTKPTGLGTGLGLSQVFGFIKQSSGDVKIHSAPGIGTTVALFLPCATEPVSGHHVPERSAKAGSLGYPRTAPADHLVAMRGVPDPGAKLTFKPVP
jgi:hypothetical protein